ncbi:protein kinase [Corallococcus sp. M34]|uniref:serine/threonine protein kinase n=1 Tax=Citreicoccus inhibens TaxID=2849499 RepID=UPI001C236596|nr:serine/threonine-protein kinase [Citreicoccus inhibens]MBU8896835.1 protein kinase [Citreicoccus inhibens]
MSEDGTLVYPAALPPGAVVGGWRIVERLGSGGYGAVYRVEHPDAPGQPFALKLSLHPDSARSLRETALLLDKAVHPHVVRVHASGRWPHPRTGLPYFVMDCIEGPALHTWADTCNPTFRQLAFAGGHVALALDLLHARGVVHRDLKPEHILIQRTTGQPILIDFGAGDVAGAPTLTTAALPPGTHHLRSPEAVHFHQRHWRTPEARYPYTHADDLYALGVCLYRAATGHYPFPPDLPTDLLYLAIATRAPPPPQAINPRIPTPLARTILRLLEKDPRRRPRHGGQLHAELVEGMLTAPEAPYATRLFLEEPRAPSQPDDAPAQVHVPRWPSRAYPPPSPWPGRLARLLPESWLDALARWQERQEPALPPPGPRPRWGVTAALCLLLGGLWWHFVQSRGLNDSTTSRVTSKIDPSQGNKLASPAESPHIGPAAVPLPVSPTPAVVATPAASPKETPAVPNPSLSHPPASRQNATPLRRALKVATVTACTGLACAGVQTRSGPPAPPCPANAVETMRKEYGLRGTEPIGVAWEPGHTDRRFNARDGQPAVGTVNFPLNRIPMNLLLKGTFIFSETRVFIRFTKAQDATGRVVPVCFDAWTTDGEDIQVGLARHPNGEANSAGIDSTFPVFPKFD